MESSSRQSIVKPYSSSPTEPEASRIVICHKNHEDRLLGQTDPSAIPLLDIPSPSAQDHTIVEVESLVDTDCTPQDPGYPCGSQSETYIEQGARRAEAWTQRWWVFELATSLVSILVFTMLVVLLAYSNGREQKSMLGEALSLNTLVAILSTTSRTLMMVSVTASVGQYKWFRLLQEPGKLEDIETIDAASRGPLGSVRLLWTVKSINFATIAALVTICALAFDAFTQQIVGIVYVDVPSQSSIPLNIARADVYNGTDTYKAVSTPEVWMTVAFYDGLMNNAIQGLKTQLQFPCETGNCTWPIIPSLAVSGHCTNVSEQVNVSCDPTCVYTLPSSPGKTWGLSTYGSTTRFLMQNVDTQLYNQTNTTYISRFITFRRTDSFLHAQVCALWLTVKAYNVTVWQGIPTETVTNEWSTSNNTVSTRFMQPDPKEFNIPANSSGFKVEYSDIVSFEKLGGIDVNMTMAGSNIFYSSEQARYLSGITDWPTWIDGFATSLTDTIRLNGNRTIDDERYEGTAYISKPFITIHWPWLIYPATVLVLAVLCQVLAIHQTRLANLPAWKNNPLALMFLDVDQSLKDSYRSKGDDVYAHMILHRVDEQRG